MCKVGVKNRSFAYFHHIFLPIIERSVVDTLKVDKKVDLKKKRSEVKFKVSHFLYFLRMPYDFLPNSTLSI